MQHLLTWLEEQKKHCHVLFEYDWDSERRVRRVFYQSADMSHNANRNGEVIVMDTTMQTNRFNMPLCILCGVNEHNHTVLLAVALTMEQDYQSFEWILKQLHTSMGHLYAPKVKTVFTDGDSAMIKALNNIFPSARLARCWFHLELNIKHNLHSKLGVAKLDRFLAQWKSVCLSLTLYEFNRAKQKLHDEYPEAEPYLTKNIWKNQMAIANCYVRDQVTWGMYSTQRVESFNRKLKNMLQRGSNTDVRNTISATQICS